MILKNSVEHHLPDKTAKNAEKYCQFVKEAIMQEELFRLFDMLQCCSCIKNIPGVLFRAIHAYLSHL